MACHGEHGGGGLGFGAGEEAYDTATTFMDGSRRETFPIFFRGGSDETFWNMAYSHNPDWAVSRDRCDYQLKGKSGASSRGNTSFRGLC